LEEVDEGELDEVAEEVEEVDEVAEDDLAETGDDVEEVEEAEEVESDDLENEEAEESDLEEVLEEGIAEEEPVVLAEDEVEELGEEDGLEVAEEEDIEEAELEDEAVEEEVEGEVEEVDEVAEDEALDEALEVTEDDEPEEVEEIEEGELEDEGELDEVAEEVEEVDEVAEDDLAEIGDDVEELEDVDAVDGDDIEGELLEAGGGDQGTLQGKGDDEEISIDENVGFAQDDGEGSAKGGGPEKGEPLDDTGDFKEIELLERAEAEGGLLEEKGLGWDDEEGIENDEKARLLAEQFNQSLAAMDRFFNQYLLIPKGKYPVGNGGPPGKERPKAWLEMAPFYMGKFPVTNALFEIFVEKTGYKTTAERLGYGTVYYPRARKRIDEETGLETLDWRSDLTSKTVEGACWYQPLGPGSTLHGKRSHPVVQVSLEDAMAFAAWTGKRLPTEEEWEAATRTAQGYPFPWGKEWKEGACNVEESLVGDTTPVDRFLDWGNEFGIADALGNVLEWTSSPWEPEEEGKRYFIVKGGSWISNRPLFLWNRFKMEPDSTSNILGFRCIAV